MGDEIQVRKGYCSVLYCITVLDDVEMMVTNPTERGGPISFLKRERVQMRVRHHQLQTSTTGEARV
jgi:hypothetical protein